MNRATIKKLYREAIVNVLQGLIESPVGAGTQF